MDHSHLSKFEFHNMVLFNLKLVFVYFVVARVCNDQFELFFVCSTLSSFIFGVEYIVFQCAKSILLIIFLVFIRFRSKFDLSYELEDNICQTMIIGMAWLMFFDLKTQKK